MHCAKTALNSRDCNAEIQSRRSFSSTVRTAALGRCVFISRARMRRSIPERRGHACIDAALSRHVKRVSGFERMRVIQLRIRGSEEQFQNRLVVVADQQLRRRIIVSAPAEALLAEIVGHAPFFQCFQNRLELDDIGRLDIANLDGKPIARQMPQAQLIVMTSGPEDRQVRNLHGPQRVFGRAEDRERLARHGAGVFHPGISNVTRLDIQST